MSSIIIKGASEHNLKNIDIEIPKNKFVVFTGVSGSGKSSLAFDTIYAEGQRRYIESLSSYARQFLGKLEKPKVEHIKGLSPAISIEQKSTGSNPRSTVGTITEIQDYLRVLFARVGTPFCPNCGKEIGSGNSEKIVQQILSQPEGSKFLLLAPLIFNRKGEHREILFNLGKEGIARVRVDGILSPLEDVHGLAKQKKHSIEAVVDRLKIKDDPSFRTRLVDSVETALRLGHGEVIVVPEKGPQQRLSELRSCCGKAFPELEPQLFSFNSPQGMCGDCNGIGSLLSMDVKKIVPDDTLSIREGALLPWRNYFGKTNQKKSPWGLNQIHSMEKEFGLNLDTPWNLLPAKDRELCLYGSGGREMKVLWDSVHVQGEITMAFEGILPAMMRRYRQTQSEHQKKYYSRFLSDQTCPACDGLRMKKEALSVKIEGQSIATVSRMSVKEALHFFQNLSLNETEKTIAKELLREICGRLGFLVNVGLDYLALDRKGPSLSGGESQRIRLASQIGMELTGILYVLDEPSIGLHPRDTERLLQSLLHLRDIGNTVIVVEHDIDTIETADWILDIGPGAGRLGGEVVSFGTLEEIKKDSHSLTGRYLCDDCKIEIPETRRKVPRKKNWIRIIGAEENNLDCIDVEIPTGVFVAFTGVSGAGKSTLISTVLYPALAAKLHNSTQYTGKHKGIKGVENIDKIIKIDQKPIGRTPRSNPVTYTKTFDLIRDLFASLPEAKGRGYGKGRFSFNVKGGRCENCKGDGSLRVEMHFLADVFITCPQCKGLRFNQATLEIKFKNRSIADILDLTVEEALDLFQNQPKIRPILQTLADVGLSYIHLGQSAVTLSGGEAQRIKLSRELAKQSSGKTLYILDEPTTGLHFHDIGMLLCVLQRLVDEGNTVIVIEHNLDVIKSVDWIIDLGPEGGEDGGRIVAAGSPEELAERNQGYTAQYLKNALRSPVLNSFSDL